MNPNKYSRSRTHTRVGDVASNKLVVIKVNAYSEFEDVLDLGLHVDDMERKYYMWDWDWETMIKFLTPFRLPGQSPDRRDEI